MGALGLHADAWTEFWRDQDEDSGCCANAPEILAPIHRHWSVFASRLPAGSHVLDLACGTGAAGRALIDANPWLSITGVDFAAVPAASDPRIEILANTRMESLPFADDSFDAAVSQFGFEYGSIDEAARELARVLRPGARFSFLVHHSGGRIATDSVRHRRALVAICGRELEVAFLAGNAAALDRQLTMIQHQCPHERIVKEADRGLRRHMGLGPAHRVEIWRAVKAALVPELTMLADLAAASVSPGQMRSWLRALAARFDLRLPAELTLASGQPLCWTVEGVRSATFH